jgi:peptidylprolyl isomerase
MKLPSLSFFRPLVRAGFFCAPLFLFAVMARPALAASNATNVPATNAPASAKLPASVKTAAVAKTPVPVPPSAPPAKAEMDKDSGKPIVTTPSGLKYVDLVPGNGPAAKTGDHLTVNYTGKLVDGSKFDSSYDRGQPMNLELGRTSLIQGWTEGLAGMKAGGKRKLIIPPQLGYGLAGYDVIPPNATLIFEVDLVAIVNPAPPAPAK